MTDSRETFNSNFDISNATLTASSFFSIKDNHISRIYEVFNRYGFVLIHLTSPKVFLEELGIFDKYFGNIIYHNRSDSSGISLIKIIPNFSNYFGTTNENTGLHTDGSCSKKPPKIVILYCEISSEIGGESQLLNCKLLYNNIVKYAPDLLNVLFEPNVFTITRDNESFTQPVFYYENDRVFTRFRGNKTAKISVLPKAKKAFNFIKKFVCDPKNILQFKLKQNQFLVIDNTMVMHGRTEFPKDSPRKLNRVFFDGNIKNSQFPYQIQFGFEPLN
ncbi:MAG: TauD/TfdA family dioxygenase [Crocosphaera sp.]|nr:TauD/TfdA family dioxygenase [Crocosphaera sp.]